MESGNSKEGALRSKTRKFHSRKVPKNFPVSLHVLVNISDGVDDALGLKRT